MCQILHLAYFLAAKTHTSVYTCIFRPVNITRSSVSNVIRLLLELLTQVVMETKAGTHAHQILPSDNFKGMYTRLWIELSYATAPRLSFHKMQESSTGSGHGLKWSLETSLRSMTTSLSLSPLLLGHRECVVVFLPCFIWSST